MNKPLSLFIGFFLFTSTAFALNVQEYQFIHQLFRSGAVKESIAATEQQIKKNKKEADWYFLLDDMYSLKGYTQARIDLLEKAVQIKKISQLPTLQFRLGKAYFDAGDYPKAKKMFQALPATASVLHYLACCAVADSLRAHPLSYQREPLSSAINTSYDNLWPSTSIHQKMMATTVVEGKNSALGFPEMWNENIYIAQQKNGEWQPTECLPFPLNTPQNEGATCFSADGNYMFFVRCQDSHNFGSCDIYYSMKNGSHWSDPINAGPIVNSKYWESTPCLSPNGKELYFSSNRPQGIGGQDIWKCSVQYLPDGKLSFSEATPLGPQINTKGDEIAPYLSADGKNLYFSSNGWPGMGGMDVFKSFRTSQGWQLPENMGYPLNTYQDEIGFRIQVNGRTAYLSAPKDSADSHRIVYQIEIPSEKQSAPLFCIEGKVIQAHSLQPLTALIEVYDAASQKTLFTTRSDAETGNFILLLQPQQAVELTIQKEGYVFASEWVDAKDSGVTIALQPLEEGVQFNLHHIYFGFDQVNPLPSSYKELDLLVDLMQTHPYLDFTIVGHTDSQGDAHYNQELSVKRAHSVVQYCLEKGIEPHRLSFLGKGDSAPIDTNETELGRQRNRRIEVLIHAQPVLP